MIIINIIMFFFSYSFSSSLVYIMIGSLLRNKNWKRVFCSKTFFKLRNCILYWNRQHYWWFDDKTHPKDSNDPCQWAFSSPLSTRNWWISVIHQAELPIRSQKGQRLRTCYIMLIRDVQNWKRSAVTLWRGRQRIWTEDVPVMSLSL